MIDNADLPDNNLSDSLNKPSKNRQNLQELGRKLLSENKKTSIGEQYNLYVTG